jgi:hypothetical protein
MFRSYIANKNTSYNHILEAISHNKKEYKILKIRYDMSLESIANSCWLKAWDDKSIRFDRIDCILHRSAYSDIMISNNIQDKQTRKTVSVLVDWHLKSIVEIKTKRVKSEERNKESIIYNFNLNQSSEIIMEQNTKQKNSDNMITRLFEKADLTLPERYIILWKLQVKQKEEVKRELGINSDATLYNRWDKIMPKLLEAFYKNNDIAEEFK